MVTVFKYIPLNRSWVSKNLTRAVEMRYNPYTQTVEVIISC